MRRCDAPKAPGVAGLPTGTDQEIEAAARVFTEQGVEKVLVKLGAKGSMLVGCDGHVIRQPAMAVERVVDTTGAGDCFTAAFVVATLSGLSPTDALKFAAAAAAICVQRSGAMPSLPRRQEVDAAMRTS